MTNEEKELLTKDLCSRLDNHSLLVKYGEEDYNIIGISFGRVILVKPLMSITSGSPLIEEVRPYLRPMSSMTEEEITEIYEFAKPYIIEVIRHNAESNNPDRKVEIENEFLSNAVIIDELNKRHFDYRGLIGKGLALEAPEGMYKNI